LKANPIKTLVIFIRSAYYMVIICTYTIVMAAMNKFSCERADRILHWWGKKMASVLNLTITVLNPHQVNFKDGERYLIMSNHSSLFDIPIIYAALPESIRMLTKVELTRVPLFGRAIKAGKVPIIDRRDRKSAINTLNQARQLMHSGIIIWLAPEGTRSQDGRLLAFKPGGFVLAIQTKAKLTPIAIQGAHKILPKHTWQFHTHQHITVHIGKPIDTSQYLITQKTELMQQVREQMQVLLKESDSAK
jgi:1-acyl-sn-glycerol-3-phosphate acyltransferase